MSSDSESDEEYVPGEPEKVSEEDSADDETETQYNKEQEVKAQKRKLTGKKRGLKTTRTKREKIEAPNSENSDCEEPKNPEEEKKREEELWAMFLGGTDNKKKSTTQEIAPKTEVNENEATKSKSIESTKKENEEREKRIFEFAGETVIVENDVVKETIPKKLEVCPTGSNSQKEVPKPRKPGLTGILNHINRKSTLSTLEKSALDWNTYKKVEGVEHEVKSHNIGKQGYLDRQEFLERADLKQFEIERDLRLKKRTTKR